MVTKKNPQATPNNGEVVIPQDSFVQKNIKTIGIAVCAIIVVVVGIFIYNEQVSKPAELKASKAIAVAQNNFAMAAQLGDSTLFVKALEGDTTGVKGFLTIADEYSGTDAGNLANLYAGICYANLNNWENAKTYIEKFDSRDDMMVSPAALGALGNIYAHLGDLDKAVETLKKAAKEADNNALSPEYLIQAGQILESQNKKEEAIKLYQEIKTKYVRSPRYAEAEQLIQAASVK